MMEGHLATEFNSIVLVATAARQLPADLITESQGTARRRDVLT